MPRVGDLILLTKLESHSRSEARVGIVRRALLKEPMLLEIGVQFINGKIVALTIQPMGIPNEQAGSPFPGLYVDLGEIGRSSLLVAKDTLVIDQEYRIEEMIPAPTISPILLTEATSSFERFRIKRI
jgi:hypothetical protein